MTRKPHGPDPAYQRAWRAAHPVQSALHKRRWRATNPDYVAAYNARRRAPLIDKVCICGRGFQASRRATLYCEMHRGDRGPGRATRYLSHRLRRARLGAPQRAIRLADVYTRDGGVCWICETAVDQELQYPDPFSASLDHVIPLKHGGRHELENVKLAHLRCNVRRGAADPRVARATEAA